MRTGKVKWFSAEKGYGFIEIEGPRDIFVHYSALSGETFFERLRPGQEVQVDLSGAPRGIAVLPAIYPTPPPE